MTLIRWTVASIPSCSHHRPGRGDWYSYESRYIKNLPIKTAGQKINDLISLSEDIVNHLHLENLDMANLLKKEIDQLVYQLYDLTPEEIALVEESVGSL
jgi:hypothetical protein